MQVKVNGNWYDFEGQRLSVTELLEKMKYTEPTIIVKFKGQIIKKTDFTLTYVTDRDEIQCIHLCGGG